MADEPEIVLSAADVAILKEMAAAHRANRGMNRPPFSLPLVPERGHIFASAYAAIPAAESNLCPGKGICKVLKHNVELDYDGCLLQTDEEIEVYNPSDKEIADGQIIIIQREARDGQYWIMPTGETPDELCHYELIETMSFGGHALAHKLVYSGGSWVVDESADPIRVYDWYSGMWGGAEEYRGIAVRRAGDTSTEGEIEVELWDVVWQERLASVIEFSLNEYMGESTAGEATASVISFDHQGKDPGSTVTVYDPGNRWPDAHNGAKGSAWLHHASGEYRIISCQRLCKDARATLDGDCCADTSPAIASITYIPVGEYVGSPEDIPIINNPRGHAGADGDTVGLIRINDMHDETSQWDIIDMSKHVSQMVVDTRVSGVELQVKKRDVYIEWCNDTTLEWEVYHTGTDCDEA